MVCARCQRLQKSTELTTPAVKLKNELNHTPQGSGGTSEYGKGKGSRTLTSAGITKVRRHLHLTTIRTYR